MKRSGRDKFIDLMLSRRDWLKSEEERMLGSPHAHFHFPDKSWPGFRGERWPGHVPDRQFVVDPLLDADGIWDRVVSIPYCVGSPVPIADRKSLQPSQSGFANTDWKETLSGLNKVGRPCGDGARLRPEGEWILDLARHHKGYEVLLAAHAMSHLRTLAKKPGDVCQTGFLECLAELVIAMRYNASCTVWCPTPEQVAGVFEGPRPSSTFEKYGIDISVSTNVRAPWLISPAKRLFHNRSTVSILAGIHIEPHPWSSSEDNPDKDDCRWLEVNRWSCMPSIVCLSGWRPCDELMRGPLVLPYRNSGREDVCVAMTVGSMYPMSIFDEIMNTDIGYDGEFDASMGVMPAAWLMEHDRLQGVLRCVPPFPCKDCLRLNGLASGAPSRPPMRRPDGKSRGDSEAEKAWSMYDAGVDRIVKTVGKACEFWDMRFGDGLKTRKARAGNARAIADLDKKAKNADARADRLEKNMEYTKAKEQRGVAKELRRQMLGLLKGD